jgi:multiple sugar transport system substrate-binding protein
VKNKWVTAILLVSVIALFTIASVVAQDDDMRRFAGTELNFIYFEQPYTQGLAQILPEFEEMTGIRVNIETLGEAATYQKIEVELAIASGAYDVVGISQSRLPLYAQNNWIIPVENFFDDPATSNQDVLNIDDFIQSTLDALAHDGIQYCLPYFAATVILYYQIDIFEEYGITAPPATFEELLEVAQTVHTSDIPAIAMRGRPGEASNIWHWTLFLMGEGGSYFADFPNDFTPVVNSPEAISATEIYAELMQNYSLSNAADAVFDDVVIAMQQGNVVMAIEGAPLGGRILDPEQSRVIDNLGFAVVPGGPAGAFPPFNSHGLCVANNIDNPEAAYMFIEWATSYETQKAVALNSPHVPVSRNSVWEDEDFIAKYDFNYGGGSFLEAFQQSLNIAPPLYRPPFPAWPEVAERVGIALQEVLIDIKTAEQALNDANRDIMQILADGGYLDD